MKGDPSADFALSTMCPQAVQPVMSAAFTAIARGCGLHRAAPILPITQPATADASATGYSAAVGVGPDEDPQVARDAARRRDLGRQALDARLVAAGMQPMQGTSSANSTPASTRGPPNFDSPGSGSPFIQGGDDQ